ncbi:tRNA preQ1(34) S-adenosylmethionine ribosyltransferase-isomerase QueA, partial [bacterium]|nr:tRNA preQ1(34) S-adenosylmethionine ribosyltransferase-isomerase QueA [bacterium]
MRLSDFQFQLPDKLIAQSPSPARDQSRLLALNRADGKMYDSKFSDILHFFKPGDALVLNETKVFPARLHGQKEKTDAKIEVFLLRELNDSLWEVLVKPARKVRTGNTIWFNNNVHCEVVDNTISGGRVVRFKCDGNFHDIVESVGDSPLPPYIKRPPTTEDKERYQTVYARVSGAVAAPTAGLHFTEELLNQISALGVEIIPILLHVGLGTFRPVCVEDLSRHHMDSEYYEISEDAAARINSVRSNGGR